MLISAGRSILLPDADPRVFSDACGDFAGRCDRIFGANIDKWMPECLSSGRLGILRHSRIKRRFVQPREDCDKRRPCEPTSSWELLMSGHILLEGNVDLAEIVATAHQSCGTSCRLNRRDNDGNQDAQNADRHQQLKHCKSASAGLMIPHSHRSSPLSPVVILRGNLNKALRFPRHWQREAAGE
jgi:hypothetical protein